MWPTGEGSAAGLLEVGARVLSYVNGYEGFGYVVAIRNETPTLNPVYEVKLDSGQVIRGLEQQFARASAAGPKTTQEWMNVHATHGIQIVRDGRPSGPSDTTTMYTCCGETLIVQGPNWQIVADFKPEGWDLEPDWRCPRCSRLGAPAMRADASKQIYISCQDCGFERRIMKSKDGSIVMDTGGDLRAPKPNGIPKVRPGADVLTCTYCGEALITEADYYRHESEHRDQSWASPKPTDAQPAPRPDPRKRFIRD